MNFRILNYFLTVAHEKISLKQLKSCTSRSLL